jgi:hypothetical protein
MALSETFLAGDATYLWARRSAAMSPETPGGLL